MSDDNPSLDEMIAAVRAAIEDACTVYLWQPARKMSHLAALAAALAQLEASRWRPIAEAPNIYGSDADIQLTDGRRQRVGCLVRDAEGRRCWQTDGGKFVSPTHFHLLLPSPTPTASEGSEP